jgi:hypothetical protein
LHRDGRLHSDRPFEHIQRPQFLYCFIRYIVRSVACAISGQELDALPVIAIATSALRIDIYKSGSYPLRWHTSGLDVHVISGWARLRHRIEDTCDNLQIFDPSSSVRMINKPIAKMRPQTRDRRRERDSLSRSTTRARRSMQPEIALQKAIDGEEKRKS